MYTQKTKFKITKMDGFKESIIHRVKDCQIAGWDTYNNNDDDNDGDFYVLPPH